MNKIALITGGTGLVGQELIPHLEARGYTVKILSRRPGVASHQTILWSAETGVSDRDSLEGADLLIHLAGANVGAKRWSPSYKKELVDSRVKATRVLFEQLGTLKIPPKIVLAAAAIGIYGNRADEFLTEESSPGDGFLPELARDWEREIERATTFGARVCLARFGIILSKRGGALEKMLLPFSLGLGGPVGSGKQWMSWVTLSDAVGSLLFLLEKEELQGAFNICTPSPVTNRTFTKALGHILRRPTFLPLPTFLVSLIFGEMGRTLLLGSTRGIPSRLSQAGFVFKHREITDGLRIALAQRKRE